MGKHRVGISFDLQFLSQLKENENNCVELLKNNQHLALHPYQLEKLGGSIRDSLSRSTGRYDKKLQGILLGYQNVKLLGDTGDINFDSCFIHVDVQAEFYVFKPEIEKELTGIVNKKSTDHVGVLVHKTFNVSLPKPAQAVNWIGENAQIGNEVTFKIVFTDLHLRLPYIRGEIISINDSDSGISTGDETVINKKKKSNKIKKFDDVEEASPKKSKKRNLDVTLDETPKLKKRKHTLSETERAELNESKEVNHISDLSANKRKSKSANIDLDNLRNSLLLEQVSLVENMAKQSKKKKQKKEKVVKDDNVELGLKKKSKKKKEKHSKDDDEVSLPDLNLNDLFSTDVTKSVDKVDMADSSDKSLKRRRHSISQGGLNFTLPEDSELDGLLQEETSRKRKRSTSESHSGSKRKRKNSSGK